MRDYFTAAREFDYASAASSTLAGDLDALNACVECCDRHAQPGRVALLWEGRNGERAEWTFAALKEAASRFANLLQARGVGPGDCVSGMLPRTPELLITILGTWRAGAVYQPLFTAFGPKAIEHRVRSAGSKLVVTDLANRAKFDEVPDAPPVLTVGDDFQAELERQPEHFEAVMRKASDPFLLMFTSGTTGLAKPLAVPLKAIVAFVSYMREAVDLRAEDRFWNLADPGWAYGLYYAVTGPLAMGHATLFYEGGFSVESTCRIIRDYGISNLAGSPTAYRLLLAGKGEVEAAIKGQLRAVSSAGEPLTPEVIRWFAEGLGCVIHDHYGQTELGMVLCNHHALQHPVRLGAAGFAMPGHRVVVLDEQQRELAVGQPGILALDMPRSPLFWFPGYQGLETRAFVGDYYLSGDTVELNADGSISFVGRADDVITTSGYRVGPFDVESALIEHPAVIEAAVVGKPDPERTELVKAFVVLHAGHAADAALAEGLQQYVRQRLSAHAYPREIEFVAELPKTPSGKIQRFLLRNQEIAKAQEAAAH
ncbi:Acetyl-coenzyme A synthetase [Pseudomonas sp. THAF187a]|uniref:AMP-binding protein n=1 Tax=unclassified Pseudomonas TaxID=196821 RepID=UPI001268608A|nr:MULTISPECIES: AMP-binding protein [unclassified Pseudomonas]QFT22434.1 Acetyl-coenzyme A synthetase [Pseudomonas sp. THAF187a]QFT42621.1 Acetyl-coenzyme A synthetase [Pseudomonas sp. THAF42]